MFRMKRSFRSSKPWSESKIHSDNNNVGLPKKMQKLSPVVKTRYQEKIAQKEIITNKNSNTDIFDASNATQQKLLKEFRTIPDDILGIGAMIYDEFGRVKKQQFDLKHLQTPEESFVNERPMSNKNFSMLKPRERIVIHSPGVGYILGTKIDHEFMRVTRLDIEKRIGLQYRATLDESFLNEIIVGLNQTIVFEPPMEKSIVFDSDSEIDDELLTSYTRKGHILIYDTSHQYQASNPVERLHYESDDEW